MVGPFTDPEGTGGVGRGHTTAEEEVLFLRPKCGPARPCTTQSAIRTGNLHLCVQVLKSHYAQVNVYIFSIMYKIDESPFKTKGIILC